MWDISLDRNYRDAINLLFVSPGLYLNVLKAEKILQFLRTEGSRRASFQRKKLKLYYSVNSSKTSKIRVYLPFRKFYFVYSYYCYLYLVHMLLRYSCTVFHNSMVFALLHWNCFSLKWIGHYSDYIVLSLNLGYSLLTKKFAILTHRKRGTNQVGGMKDNQ